MKRVGRGKRPKSLKRVENERRTVSLTHFDLKRSCKIAEVLANRPQFVCSGLWLRRWPRIAMMFHPS